MCCVLLRSMVWCVTLRECTANYGKTFRSEGMVLLIDIEYSGHVSQGCV